VAAAAAMMTTATAAAPTQTPLDAYAKSWSAEQNLNFGPVPFTGPVNGLTFENELASGAAIHVNAAQNTLTGAVNTAPLGYGVDPFASYANVAYMQSWQDEQHLSFGGGGQAQSTYGLTSNYGAPGQGIESIAVNQGRYTNGLDYNGPDYSGTGNPTLTPQQEQQIPAPPEYPTDLAPDLQASMVPPESYAPAPEAPTDLGDFYG
jgi:hypothetical protein